jgi:prefoldin alpha subunit
MKDNREMEQKLVQFKALENSMNALIQKEEEVAIRIEEYARTKLALRELEKIKENNALIPIGAGNFISGVVSDSKSVVVGFSGGLAIKKTREQAMDIVDEKIKEMEKAMRELENERKKITDSMLKIQDEVESSRQ